VGQWSSPEKFTKPSEREDIKNGREKNPGKCCSLGKKHLSFIIFWIFFCHFVGYGKGLYLHKSQVIFYCSPIAIQFSALGEHA